MKLTTQQSIEELIEKLDEKTIIGYDILLSITSKYNHIKEDTDESTERIRSETHEAKAKWHIEVETLLKNYLGNSHVIYEFSRIEQPQINRSNLPTPLFDLDVEIDGYLKSLNGIIIRLEERESLFIKQEIAKKEYDASHRYWLTYDEIAGKLYLNGNIIVSSTRLDSPADRLMRQVFGSPNNLIEIYGITSTQISSALRDLNLTGTLKKMFFPRTSGKSKKILFRPFITNTEFFDAGYEDINLADFMRKNEK
jgi:hypothetical protein